MQLGVVASQRRKRRLGGSSDGSGVTPPTPSNPAPVIRYSVSNDRSSPTVAGTVSGTIYVFLTNTDVEIDRVQWFLNPPDPNDLPAEADELADPTFVRGDATVPFDLKGGSTTANPFDTTALTDGNNVVAVRVLYTNGGVTLANVTFDVDNGGASPTVPATPVLTSVTTPADGHALVQWTAVSGSPLDYDIEYDDNSSFTTPVALPAGSPTVESKLITGLSAGLLYFRVRGTNATGDGDWSNTVSATITASESVPQTARFDYTLRSDAMLRYGYTEGGIVRKASGGNGGQYATAAGWRRSNATKTTAGTRAIGDGAIQSAWDAWTGSQQYIRAVQTFGPRGVITIGVALDTAANNAQGAANAVETLEALALTATSITAYNNDATYRKVFEDIETSTHGNNPQGYWTPRMIVCPGNENNADTNVNFSGIDFEHIEGNAAVQTLANDTTRFDATTRAALQYAYNTGNRGRVYLEATRRIRLMRDQVMNTYGSAGVALALNFSTPSSTVPVPGAPTSDAYNAEMMPTPAEGLYDTIGCNIYCRGSQRTLAAYQEPVEAVIALADEYNRPFCMIEWGFSFDRPDVGTGRPTPVASWNVDYNNGPTDSQWATAFEWLWDTMGTIPVAFAGHFAVFHSDTTAKPKGSCYRMNFTGSLGTNVEADWPLANAKFADKFGFI